MKKITSLIFTFLMLSFAVPCFAAPSDIASTISQNNFVDIIVWVGIALFALGILFILLSIYLGFKSKKQPDEDFDEYDEDIEFIDNPDSENSYDDELSDASEENIESPDSVVDNENEIADISNDVPIEDSDEKSESYDIEPDVADSVENTTDDEKEVKITLSGLNNSDVKFAVFSDFATLGRKSDNDIVISDNAVSGTHCKFTYEDGKVYIEDLNSTNGTMLNDEIVSKSEISNGDTIIIGKCKYRISIYD